MKIEIKKLIKKVLGKILKIEIFSKTTQNIKTITKWIKTLPKSLDVGILFGGDRLNCITHFVVAKIFWKIVGIVTIAREGENKSGIPTIIAIYVKKEWRRKGIGTKLFHQTIEYMIKEKMVPIEITVFTTPVSKIIDALDDNKKKFIIVKVPVKHKKLRQIIEEEIFKLYKTV